MPELIDLLTDFGSRARPEPARMPLKVDAPALVSEQPPEIDVEAIVTARVAKAEHAVTERLTALYEATLQAERDNHAAEREELRRNLGSEAVALIEAQLTAMQEQLTTLTTTAAARILGSLLTDEMQKRAIGALSARIDEAIRDRDTVRVRVQGPQSLCEALEAALGERAAGIEFVERASFDLTVTIDSSIYETRLAAWSSELAGVIA
jgi:hypothetical protein